MVRLSKLSERSAVMDVCLLIKQRLVELGLEQKDLASAAEVTESYISQVLTRKKLPPAPDTTMVLTWSSIAQARKKSVSSR